MAEKAFNNEGQSAAKKERFEFKLTVNGNIICQRYFRINGFKSEVYGSVDLIDTIDDCVEKIDKDMRDKTHMFLEYTAPQVVQTEDDVEPWVRKHGRDKYAPMYILVADTSKVYTHKDGVVIPYDKMFNHNDYVADKNYENKVLFKFAFLDNGREVASKVWDGSMYPRFIRTNVDLSNSRNKYRQDNIFAPIEAYMVDQFNKEKADLIPQIVKELCSVCSYDDVEEYTNTLKYGDKVYDLNIRKANRKYIRTLDNLYRKKTAEYFRHI